LSLMGFLRQISIWFIRGSSRCFAGIRNACVAGIAILCIGVLIGMAPIAKAKVQADEKRCFADYKMINNRLALQTVANCSLFLALPRLSSSRRVAALKQRASQYFFLKRYHEAVADYSAVITAEPEIAVNYFWRAFYYTRIGMQQEAIRDFQKSLQLDPSHKPIVDQLKRLGVNGG
jgi:tetratricopeptide (TPR) repeat protein